MKKILLAFSLLFSLNAKELRVGITPYPNAFILENIKDDLKEIGYELKIIEFNDYILPNLALEDGELDLNMFQHEPFMNEFNESKKTHIVKVSEVFLPPMAIYSKKVKNIANVKNNALIYVPNDPTNESRALELLEAANLIKLDENAKFKTVLDISHNPKNLIIKELEAAQVPRVLDECDLAVINTNYALAAKLNPISDSIFIESLNSPYVNIVAAKKGNENSKQAQDFIKALKTPKMKELILKEFKGAIIPAW
ncbi:MetQ/NlpA family ABC transporter substrate-binding protein [Campylobacter canadensis]|uniref:MetQ/NlpA family ABC transporter substrate-binding protein n=1 Tax=Campylobacter canadensis TaxID=449520 RepID=A0ABS7WPI5_9BACT|nr:MetQ/NlpA family ABC transporter substrate-binding protein [Campylobacter canadensis]MBZ7986681.1 MetQ/NlpA family ABC transporter substrate-binding protein [Campylobacter canadensis]MBZ7993914.1 MetQ/NlpA family ABC transporter substrate-binding protein [Campylobacter canadensis]MBZ7996230.1 MetQ/NlpA family ABC transporter substrate-binding protein [Campylobacter canadensis]MBZ7997717.1 MetQ/NlpA family ABC transporter substrate-binding protein [Campylobacter canadensis]MBZ7999247.1 MetQ/